MTPNDLREYVVRMEGYADGIKTGAQLAAQWMAQELAKAEKAKEPAPAAPQNEAV